MLCDNGKAHRALPGGLICAFDVIACIGCATEHETAGRCAQFGFEPSQPAKAGREISRLRLLKNCCFTWCPLAEIYIRRAPGKIVEGPKGSDREDGWSLSGDIGARGRGLKTGFVVKENLHCPIVRVDTENAVGE